MSMTQLRAIIEDAYESRAQLTPKSAPAPIRSAVESALDALDAGTLRVAEKHDGRWQVNEWLKKAVLLSFRLAKITCQSARAIAAFTTRCR